MGIKPLDLEKVCGNRKQKQPKNALELTRLFDDRDIGSCYCVECREECPELCNVVPDFDPDDPCYACTRCFLKRQKTAMGSAPGKLKLVPLNRADRAAIDVLGDTSYYQHWLAVGLAGDMCVAPVMRRTAHMKVADTANYSRVMLKGLQALAADARPFLRGELRPYGDEAVPEILIAPTGDRAATEKALELFYLDDYEATICDCVSAVVKHPQLHVGDIVRTVSSGSDARQFANLALAVDPEDTGLKAMSALLEDIVPGMLATGQSNTAGAWESALTHRESCESLGFDFCIRLHIQTRVDQLQRLQPALQEKLIKEIEAMGAAGVAKHLKQSGDLVIWHPTRLERRTFGGMISRNDSAESCLAIADHYATTRVMQRTLLSSGKAMAQWNGLAQELKECSMDTPQLYRVKMLAARMGRAAAQQEDQELRQEILRRQSLEVVRAREYRTQLDATRAQRRAVAELTPLELNLTIIEGLGLTALRTQLRSWRDRRYDFGLPKVFTPNFSLYSNIKMSGANQASEATMASTLVTMRGNLSAIVNRARALKLVVVSATSANDDDDGWDEERTDRVKSSFPMTAEWNAFLASVGGDVYVYDSNISDVRNRQRARQHARRARNPRIPRPPFTRSACVATVATQSTDSGAKTQSAAVADGAHTHNGTAVCILAHYLSQCVCVATVATQSTDSGAKTQSAAVADGAHTHNGTAVCILAHYLSQCVCVATVAMQVEPAPTQKRRYQGYEDAALGEVFRRPTSRRRRAAIVLVCKCGRCGMEVRCNGLR
eukprot:COSAG01_NODE_7546_length_3157_cov_3.524853_3_plen_777_part_00